MKPEENNNQGRRWIDTFDELTDAMADGGPLLAACVAVRLCGVSKERVYQLIRSGALWSCRVKGQLHVRARDIEARWGQVEKRQKAALLGLLLLLMGVCLGKGGTVPVYADVEYSAYWFIGSTWDQWGDVAYWEAEPVGVGVTELDWDAHNLTVEGEPYFDVIVAVNEEDFEGFLVGSPVSAPVAEIFRRADGPGGVEYFMGVYGAGLLWFEGEDFVSGLEDPFGLLMNGGEGGSVVAAGEVRLLGGGGGGSGGGNVDVSQVSSVADYASVGAGKALGITVAILVLLVILAGVVWGINAFGGRKP